MVHKTKTSYYLAFYRKFVDPWSLAIFSKACHQGTEIKNDGARVSFMYVQRVQYTESHDWFNALLSPS